MTDKEQLRKEFDALECNTILSEIEMNDRDTLFNWFLSKLESKDKEIAELMGRYNTKCLELVECQGAIEATQNKLGETKALNNAYAAKIERLGKLLLESEMEVKELREKLAAADDIIGLASPLPPTENILNALYKYNNLRP